MFNLDSLVTTEPQNVYWLFSSSAQAISAFVAFLITGYAFVHSIMDNLQKDDDEISDIHQELKRQYYKNIKRLSWITALAILTSLSSVFANGTYFLYKMQLYSVSIVLDIAAIAFGVYFVLSIINPDKYRKIAKQMIDRDKQILAFSGRKIAKGQFLDSFIKLEKRLRAIFEQSRETSVFRTSPTARQLIAILYKSQKYEHNLFEELLEINKIRNLVVHGQIDEVDDALVKRVDELIVKLENIKITVADTAT